MGAAAAGQTAATATRVPSRVCDLHHSSRQHQILSPLSEARDRTRILMGPSRVCYHRATTGTPYIVTFQTILFTVGQLEPHEEVRSYLFLSTLEIS